MVEDVTERREAPATPSIEPIVREHEPMLRFFEHDHLKPPLREVSEQFAGMAAFVMTLPRNAERTAALRKLLEAKDCACRAALPPKGT